MAVNEVPFKEIVIENRVLQGIQLEPPQLMVTLSVIPLVTQRTTFISYADDTNAVQAFKVSSDDSLLQKDQVALYKWTEINDIQFNVDNLQALPYQLNRYSQVATTILWIKRLVFLNEIRQQVYLIFRSEVGRNMTTNFLVKLINNDSLVSKFHR